MIIYQGVGNDSYGSVINKVAGNPGTTIGLSYSKSVSATLSGSGGVSTPVIDVTVGFRTSKSYSVSYTGSYKVESKANGKNVKIVTMSAKPIYQNHRFQTKTKAGISGMLIAKKPIGIYYSKSYTYK